MATGAAAGAASATAKNLLGEDKFNFLTAGLSGALNQAMSDPFEFLKKSWAGVNSLPKSVVPTFDIEELDKRITDMKAVETWLQLNLSMLQGSIKTMEIQRGTLVTLKDLGQSLTAKTANGLAKDLAQGISQTAATQTASAWWDMLQQQFAQVSQAASASMQTAQKENRSEVKTTKATKATTATKGKAPTSKKRPSTRAKG